MECSVFSFVLLHNKVACNWVDELIDVILARI